MEGPKVIGAHQPVLALPPVETGHVPLQATLLPQHHGQFHAPRFRQLARHDPVEPCLGVLAGDAIARKARDIEQPDRLLRGLALGLDERRGIGPFHGAGFLEILRREIERDFKAPAGAPTGARRIHALECTRNLELAPRRQLFVGIGQDEAARIELGGGLTDVFLVRLVQPEAGHVHAVDVLLRLAVDHPFRQCLADTAALRKARHHAAGHPVAARTGRADKRVAVGRKGKGPVDPPLDADAVQTGKPFEPERQFLADPVDVFRDQVHAVIPGRTVHVPVNRLGLVHAKQQPVAFLPRIGVALRVDHDRHLALEGRERIPFLGDEVMVFHRRDRQVDADHAAKLLGPEAAAVDHVFGVDRALLGHHVPAAVAALVQRGDPVAQDHVGATLFRGGGIGMGRPVRVKVAFVRIVKAAQNVGRLDDPLGEVLDLFRAEQLRGVDAECLEGGPAGLGLFPARRVGRQVHAAGHVQTATHAAFFLDLPVQLDRVVLQRGDVRIAVQRVKPRGCVPGGTCGQFAPLDQGHIMPAELG